MAESDGITYLSKEDLETESSTNPEVYSIVKVKPILDIYGVGIGSGVSCCHC